MTTQPTTPPTCPKCGSKHAILSDCKQTVFECGSMPGFTSPLCGLRQADNQIAQLEASLTAALTAKEGAERERDAALNERDDYARRLQKQSDKVLASQTTAGTSESQSLREQLSDRDRIIDDCHHDMAASNDEVKSLRERLAAVEGFQNQLATWIHGNVQVVNFLHQLSNQQFQMHGRYDGSISAECKELFKTDREFTLKLLDLKPQG
jgi:hypothetical protein